MANKETLSSSLFMVVTPCSALIGANCSPGSFEGPQRYALDKIAPHERQKPNDRQCRHDRCRRQQRDINAALALKSGKPDGKRVSRFSRQYEREKEFVPAQDEGQEAGRKQAWRRYRD